MKQTRKPPSPMTPSWDLVKPSWQLVVKHIDQIVFLFLLPSALYLLGSVLVGDTAHMQHISDITRRQSAGFAIIAAGGLWSLINAAPSLYFRLQAAKGKSVKLATIYRRGFGYFWRLVGMYLLLVLAVIVGLILLVLPGLVAIYFIISRYYLAGYFLVDRDLSIRQALAASRLETDSVRLYIWGIIGVQLVFGLVGSLLASLLLHFGAILALVIGIVCLFLPALRYREIAQLQAPVKK